MKLRAAAIILLFLLPRAGVNAQAPAIATEILFIQGGSRPAGMGNCFVAVADDAAACYWNPGGLPFIEGHLSSVGAFIAPASESGDLEYLCGAVAFRTERIGTFAVSWAHLTHPSVPCSSQDDPGRMAWFTPSEDVHSIAYALAPFRGFGIGVNVKHVQHDVWPTGVFEWTDGSASATAFDVGVLGYLPHSVGPWEALLRLGASGQHLGSDLHLERNLDTGDTLGYTPTVEWPLPRNLKLGVSYRVRRPQLAEALICFEYSRSLVNTNKAFFGSEHPVLGLGLEFQTSVLSLARGAAHSARSGSSDVVVGRLGYVHDDDGEVKGLTYGLGIGLEAKEGSFTLDLANVPQAEGLSRRWHVGGAAFLTF